MIVFVGFVFVGFVFSDGMSDLEQLKEIEKIIGKELKPCPADKDIMESSSEVKQTYILNDNQQVIALNLYGNNLKNTNFLKTLKNLIQLDLRNNKLIEISELDELKNLSQLNLSNNQLSEINSLNGLKNLNHLNLSNNQLTEIKALSKLKNLIRLNLRNNQLYNVNALKELKNIMRLNLRNNQLSDISALKNLKNLKQLNLRNNQINDINTLKTLKKLTWLDLSSNQLSNISALETLINLTWLELRSNQISEINALKELKKLTLLDLTINQLKILPEWLLEFNLYLHWEWDFLRNNAIFLKDNPLEEPPPEVIKKGNNDIRDYFEQLKLGKDYIYEAKLILIGEGGAGKTSLANKVINPDYQLLPESEAESTQGIDILRFQFPYKNKTFRVNIWDFGGQEIYHQTHQFFLSKRSLYFLIADNRKEDTDFYYWLNAVDLLTNNSPLLIIKNEKHNRSRQIPESQLKAEFNNIKDILATNLSDNRGLDTIINSLQHYISQLPHVGTPLPKTWVKVREQLEQDNRYHIDLKEYFDICQQNGFEKEADKLQLSGYLHDLGVCLHFQDDELLHKTLILKPTWATDAVYKVLDNRQVISNFGRFNKDDLADIWQDEQYTTMRGELLALMLNFKLCFEIPNQAKHYIAPQLLDNNASDYSWQVQDNLLLRYQYEFMPKGLVSQFIVVMHEHIADDYSLLWKSGVVLEKEQTQAEIIEYYGKREIHIRVSGQQKKELLNIVSYELDKINNSYERLKDKCKKLIPCCCSDCSNSQQTYFYNDATLRKFRKDRQERIQCQSSYQMVSVLALIEDSELAFKNAEAEKDLRGLRSEVEKNNQQNHYEKCTFNNSDINKIEENNMSNGGDTIHAKNYIKEMNGGNIAGRDININGGKTMTKEEFLQLLEDFKKDVAESQLPNDVIEDITTEMDAAETQLKKENPRKSMVNGKFTTVNDLLEETTEAIDVVEKGVDLFEKIVATAVILAANTAIFF